MKGVIGMINQRGGRNRGPHGSGKAYREYCRVQTKNGLINGANGDWVPEASSGRLPSFSSSAHHNVLAGYKLVGSRAGKQKARQARD